MISIIIPTYCPDSYIKRCIQSIEEQLNLKEMLEVIIVLNGKRYPYETYLKDFILESKLNIKYIYTSQKGVSNARNIGLDHSKGDYIFFLDDDDILSKNYFDEMCKCLDANVIVASNVYSFYSDVDEKLKDYLTFKKNNTNLILNRKYLSNSCCKLIPKEIIGNRRFNINFTNGEDALFMFLISDKIKVIKVTPSSIYYRRLRIGSASRRKISLLRRVERIVRQQVEYSKIYFSNPLKYNFLLYLTRLIAVLKQ